MKPFSCDYTDPATNKHFICGVRDEKTGTEFFHAMSIFSALTYRTITHKPSGIIWRALKNIPDEHKRLIEKDVYLTLDGVKDLEGDLLSKKSVRSRSLKKAFFRWFYEQFENTVPIEQIAQLDLGRVFAADPECLIDQIKSLETQVDKLAGENEDLHSRLHASNVAYEHLQADADEANEEIENLRDELAKAHATIDRLSNALVDRL